MNVSNELKMEHRKMRKVLVERQRRDRIERCFEQLNIMLQQAKLSAENGQVAGISKIEKAELLEMTVGYVWRVQAGLVRQTSLGFDSCVREVDAFFARSTLQRLPVTSSGTACSISTTSTDAKPETTSLSDIDDEHVVGEHLLRRLTHCSAELRRASVSSTAEAASATLMAPNATTTGGVVTDVQNYHKARSSSSLSVDCRLRPDAVDENYRRHSVASSSRVVSGHVTRVNSGHTMRPLRDINGNQTMRVKSADEQRLRTKKLATSADTGHNNSKCPSISSELPLSIAARLFPVHVDDLPSASNSEHAEVEKVFPMNADDRASSTCDAFRARHEHAIWHHRLPSTSGFASSSTCRIPDTVVVKVEPNEMPMDDMWRPW